MNDLTSLLGREQLDKLRRSYRADELVAANVTGVGQAYPPLASWNREIGATFYAADGPLTPINRERCMVALLAYAGPPISLAVHVYWGLMEGLTVDELCQVIGLTGCYGGLPRCVQGLLVLERMLGLLERLGKSDRSTAAAVLQEIVVEFQRG
jgi:alkylhydroperoxidase/carboxymuconolactone decarboxylase family protein YurZ